MAPIHRVPRHAGGFTALGPDDPEVRAAFPHVPVSFQKAAKRSWQALARVIRPPGRRWMARMLDRAELPRVTLTVPGLHAAFDGYTIAFLSDIHAGPYLGADVLSVLFERVTRAKPDLIVLGGDMVNYEADEAIDVADAMAKLRAKDGVLSVPGNHDHYSQDILRIIKTLEKAGALTLMNHATTIERRGQHLALLGVDDGGAGRFDLARARERSRDTATRVLLSHTPDALPFAQRCDVDVMLSGHTHGGQVRAPGIPPITTHTRGRFVDGIYRAGRTTAFVGRGVGVVCVPLRAFCPPHVPLVTLQAAPSESTSLVVGRFASVRPKKSP